jgi:prepilin-type N-terminal cleavage/methylation domain-containing protein
MLTDTTAHRRGMTLVELMVVVAILCLLAVAVLPTLGRSPQQAMLREAAASVDGHINQAVSKAIGSRTGHGVWFESVTNATTSPTVVLAFCQGVTPLLATGSLTVVSPTNATATLAMTPSYQTLTGTTVVPSGTLIGFVGYPYDYELISQTTVSLIRGSVGQTASNMIWPTVQPGSQLPFSLSIPPTKTSGIKTPLRGNACLDLTTSTVGVFGYSPTTEIPTNNSPLVITFDSLGRLKTATYSATGSPTPKQIRVNARTPIALLVGMRDQVGQATVANPSEDDPGANWQRKDSWWVVIDPRTSTTFVVQNAPNAASLAAAQKFIRQTLLNRNDAL